MKKELKRQIKEDQLVSGMGLVWRWLHARHDQLRVGGIVAIVVLAAVLGFSWFRSSRVQESEAAFAEALATFHAQVTAGQPAGTPPPAGPSFATAEEKYAKALEQFDGVAARWGSLPAGPRAKYYGALSRLELGQVEPAREALAQLASSGDRPLAARARLALAAAQSRSGQSDKAVETLRQLADDDQVVVPRDYVLMTLASTLEDARRSGEAGAAYERVAQEFPESVFAAEARRRADYLKNAAS